MLLILCLILLILCLSVVSWFFHLITHDSFPNSFKFILLIYAVIFSSELLLSRLNRFSSFRGVPLHREFFILSFGPILLACVLSFAYSFISFLASLGNDTTEFTSFRYSLIAFGVAFSLLSFTALSFFLVW